MKWFRRQGEPAEPISEQREFERIRMILGVVCRQRGEDFNIFTDDVSVRGIRFISQHPVHIDEDATLFVMLPPDQKISLKGKVVWARDEGTHQFVGGISFTDTPKDVEQRWADFIFRNRSGEASTPAQ